MRSRRCSLAMRLARGLLALSQAVRRRGVSAFCDGQLGPAWTRCLLIIADAMTAQAARIALRAHARTPSVKLTASSRQNRVVPASSAEWLSPALLVTMRIVPVALLGATLWPGFQCVALMATVACAALSATVRKQHPTADRITDWDIAVALCFGAVIVERLIS